MDSVKSDGIVGHLAGKASACIIDRTKLLYPSIIDADEYVKYDDPDVVLVFCDDNDYYEVVFTKAQLNASKYDGGDILCDGYRIGVGRKYHQEQFIITPLYSVSDIDNGYAGELQSIINS